MGELDESAARRFVTDTAGTKDPLGSVTEPITEAEELLPEVQNAIRAARESADSAIGTANVINRLYKTAEGKKFNGSWVSPAVDSLRSALLFASGGLDTSLKRLVKHSLKKLAVQDESVDEQFRKWAEQRVGDAQTGAVQAKELVQILLSHGVTPRDSLISTWIYTLTDGSAQSAARVSELAQALGVTDSAIRKRTAHKAKTILHDAFTARNQIAHELDVVDPDAETRKPLEKIRRYRKQSDITEWCCELLDVTQLITNDVAYRLAKS